MTDTKPNMEYYVVKTSIRDGETEYADTVLMTLDSNYLENMTDGSQRERDEYILAECFGDMVEWEEPYGKKLDWGGHFIFGGDYRIVGVYSVKKVGNNTELRILKEYLDAHN